MNTFKTQLKRFLGRIRLNSQCAYVIKICRGSLLSSLFCNLIGAGFLTHLSNCNNVDIAANLPAFDSVDVKRHNNTVLQKH